MFEDFVRPSPVDADITVSLIHRGGTTEKRIGALIRFSGDFVDGMKWDAGTKLKVQIGKQEDVGLLRFVMDRDGYTLMRNSGSRSLQFVIPLPRDCKYDRRPAARCEMKTKAETSLIIQLPGELKTLFVQEEVPEDSQEAS